MDDTNGIRPCFDEPVDPTCGDGGTAGLGKPEGVTDGGTLIISKETIVVI